MKPMPLTDDSAQAAMHWLLRLQSPELTESEERQFFAWLEISTEHQQAYIDAEAYWDGLGALKTCEVANKPAPRRWYPQAIAASVLVLVLGGLLVFQFGPGQGLDTYRSAVGEQRQISLDDGSSIILNTNSQLRVKTLSPSKPRLVYLDFGEALFSVQSDPERPFIVNTSNGAVRVLGTRFAIRADATDTLVTVVEGKVAVADSLAGVDFFAGEWAAKDFKVHTTLTADQQLSMLQARQGVLPARVDAKSLTFWKEGQLVYNNVALDQVVKDLGRYFDGDIVLSDTVLSDTVLSDTVLNNGTASVEALKHRKVVAVIELKDKASTIAAIESAFNVIAVNRSDSLTVLYPGK